MALVVYSQASILPVFQEQVRMFEFTHLNQNLTISQDWNTHGVSAVVWEAAIVLATYLQNIHLQVKGKKIIELGSGTGLSGIVASLLGANVTFTDLEKSLQTVCKVNVERNLNTSLHHFVLKPLDWCTDLKESGWALEDFDLIIGADLVYLEDLFEHLLETISFFLKMNPNAHMLLSGKIRYAKRYAKFKRLAEKRFRVERL